MAAAEIRSRLSIGQRVVLVFGSSSDELIAQKAANLLPSHVNTESDKELLHQVIRVARLRPDLSFVFRPHPRLFPNRRESHVSKESTSILDNQDVPQNVIIQTPKDNIGVHDLLMIANVVWSHRSTTALEALLLGIPTFATTESPLCVAPESVLRNLKAASDSEVVNEIDDALLTGWQISRVVACARWIATSHFRTTWSVSHKQLVQKFLPQLIHYNFWKLYMSVRFGISNLRLKRYYESDKSRPCLLPVNLNHPVSFSLSNAAINFHSSATADGVEEELIREFIIMTERLLSPWDGSEGVVGELVSWIRSKEF